MRVSAILVLACSCLAACYAPQQVIDRGHAAARAPATEDQVFDANRTTPVKVLRDLYEQNRVLVLGFPSHGNETQYQILDTLLQEIGHDPRLKFIILERSYQDAPMLEAASTTALSVPALVSRFPSEARAKLSLCIDGEFAYTWAQFLPRIRALNAQRPAGHKVLVTAVDGVDLARAVDVGNPFALLAILEGAYRENATSANFWTRMGTTLGPSDKVIMVYNIAHVIRTFTVLADGQRVPSNWMGILLRDHPDVAAHIGVVLLDEDLPVSESSPGGAAGVTGLSPQAADSGTESLLTFTQRQVSRYPGQAFGIRLAPFRRVTAGQITADTGMAVFAYLPPLGNYGRDISSGSTLPAMADGVLWLPAPRPRRFRKVSEYLSFCGKH